MSQSNSQQPLTERSRCRRLLTKSRRDFGIRLTVLIGFVGGVCTKAAMPVWAALALAGIALVFTVAVALLGIWQANRIATKELRS